MHSYLYGAFDLAGRPGNGIKLQCSEAFFEPESIRVPSLVTVLIFLYDFQVQGYSSVNSNGEFGLDVVAAMDEGDGR